MSLILPTCPHNPEGACRACTELALKRYFRDKRDRMSLRKRARYHAPGKSDRWVASRN